ncbi:MAG: DoxX family protein [Pseudonocardiaceae bacterium]
MDVIFLIGRILFVIVFLASAMGHLTQTEAMTGYAKSKGVPTAQAAVVGGGVVLVLGGMSVLLGLWGDLGALLLVAFLLPTALTMHAFWKESEPASRMNEMIQFNKDIALAGAALVLFVAFSDDELGITVTDPLLGLG